jgi:hypothetical protein
MTKFLLMIALSLAAMASANAQDQRQATVDCLQRAQANYAQAWTRECAARSLGSNNCGLPRLAAAELRSDRSVDQSFCFSANAAGLFKTEEPIVMPGAGTAPIVEPEPAPDSPPRRKFWISPQ